MSMRYQLERTLHDLGLAVAVMAPIEGHSVSVYPVRLGTVKADALQQRLKDVAGRLGLSQVRGAFIEGSSRYGLELPNNVRENLNFEELPKAYKRAKLPLFLGCDVYGKWQQSDLRSAPHILVGGGTGSGKSTAIHGFICTLMQHLNAHQLRFVLIDPKRVELSAYKNSHYLLHPVISDSQQALQMLEALCYHMDKRYSLLESQAVRDVEHYNEKQRRKLPYIVVVIDELADLMLMSKAACETALVRLAQKARAVGIHLILATQQPKSEVVTSLIKVNIPARLAFAVGNHHESRAILDNAGAEQLLGQGDCLFYDRSGKMLRLQSPFIADSSITQVLKQVQRPFYDQFLSDFSADFSPNVKATDHTIAPNSPVTAAKSEAAQGVSAQDALLAQVKRLAHKKGQLTLNMLVDYELCSRSQARKVMQQLRDEGFIGQHSPRLGYSPLLAQKEASLASEAQKD